MTATERLGGKEISAEQVTGIGSGEPNSNDLPKRKPGRPKGSKNSNKIQDNKIQDDGSIKLKNDKRKKITSRVTSVGFDADTIDEDEEDEGWGDEEPDDESLLEMEDADFEVGADFSGDLLDTDGYQAAIDSDDPVGMYIKEAGRTPLLTADEEIELAKRMEAAKEAGNKLKKQDGEGDNGIALQELVEDGELAKEYLIKANGRLVISIAKKYMGRGLPFLDLIQEGNIGLMKAVSKYDYRRGFRVSTYATWWIRQSITRAIADSGRTIRVPVHTGDRIRRILKVQRKLEQVNGREPTAEEIANEMKLDVKKVKDLLSVGQGPLSFEQPVGDGDSTLGDFIEAEAGLDPGEIAAEFSFKEVVATLLEKLSLREQEVLRMRFGLDDGKDHTLEEVGNKFGVTRERIRQIEQKAFRKLRATPDVLRLRRDELK